eukprot:365296-Chlamydomonas_euryale.AAC.1
MENILIHELGHTVMNVGLDDTDRAAVVSAWEAACREGMYTPGIYMISNADEYWAEGCQSWFDATVRTDVNDGHNTRESICSHDPRLAGLLMQAFGNTAWRYPVDCPKPLMNWSEHCKHKANLTGKLAETLEAVPPDQIPGMERARLVTSSKPETLLAAVVPCITATLTSSGCRPAQQQYDRDQHVRQNTCGILSGLQGISSVRASCFPFFTCVFWGSTTRGNRQQASKKL